MGQLHIPKPDDQENIERIFISIQAALSPHLNREGNLVVSALWSIIVDNYVDSGISFETFCRDLEDLKVNYKGCWERAIPDKE